MTVRWRALAAICVVSVLAGALSVAAWALIMHDTNALFAIPAFVRLVAGLAVIVATYVVIELAALWIDGPDQTPPSLAMVFARVAAILVFVNVVPVRDLLLADVSLPVERQVLLSIAGLGMIVPYLLMRRFTAEDLSDEELARLWPRVPPSSHPSPDYDVLIVDGSCAFCTGAARFVLDRDTKGALYIATRDSAFAAGVFARHPELSDVDSVLWVTGDAVLGEWVHSRWGAVNAIGRYLGGGWGHLTSSTQRLFPRRSLDWGYDAVAARRHQLVRGASCVLPRPAEARRLLA